MTTREKALAAELERIKESQNKTLEGILKTRGDRLSDPDGFTRVKDRQEAYREGWEFGVIWEAQRSAVLLEALEKIASDRHGYSEESASETASAALEKYRGKQ